MRLPRESFCILVPGFLMECSVTAAAYHKRKYTYSLAETYVRFWTRKDP